ncbi:MAG: reverse transcriptase family protein, partial [Flavobacteriales bacterium]|nr:reverse transcriptase family protein [Flavobacteriales bacterium]
MTRYSVNTFLKCSSPNEMDFMLGVSNLFMQDFVDTTKDYHVFKIKKRKGGFREIQAPNKELKRVQKRLAEILKEVYQIQSHRCCFGYIGNSIVENAKCHIGKRQVLNMDIKNFYASIKKGTISNVFKLKPFGFPDSVVRFLTEITCRDHLPTGAPTSPVMSNIVCWWLDEQLNNLAKENDLVYSRYVDDLTFSGGDIEKYKFSENVKKILEKFELNLNEKKTRLHAQSSRQMVTGITVNEKPNINRKYIRKVRSELYQLNTFPDKVNEKRLKIIEG